MRNVHLLPTYKPSRLAGSEYITNEQGIDKRAFKLKLWNKIISNKDLRDVGYIPQNIYITSDEEIKEGDRDFYILANDRDGTWINRVEKVIECKIDPNHGKVLILSSGFIYIDEGCKIILTDNPDLIAEGVQPIDNEFLEWFVKNPSCERVEVILQHQYHSSKEFYHDADYVNCTKEQYEFIKKEIPTCPLRIVYKIIISQEEPKQETLEDSIYQAIGLAANEQGIINQALATSKVMDVLKKQIYETRNT